MDPTYNELCNYFADKLRDADGGTGSLKLVALGIDSTADDPIFTKELILELAGRFRKGCKDESDWTSFLAQLSGLPPREENQAVIFETSGPHPWEYTKPSQMFIPGSKSDLFQL